MALQKTSRPAVKWHGYEISPVAQVLRLTPFPQSGLIWNRPIGVRVQPPQGAPQYLPIYDLTRIIQIGIVTGGLLLFFLLNVIYKRS